MKKILFVMVEGQDEKYRVKRLLEESEKRGYEAEIMISSGSSISTEGVSKKGEKFDFNNYDAIYFVGNGTIHHYIIEFITETLNKRVWPEVKHFSISDKFSGGMFLDSIGVAIPKTILLTSKEPEIIDKLVSDMGGYPLVVKKVTGSEGRYVGLVSSNDEVLEFINDMPHPSIAGKKNIILQEYIEESKGTDFRVYCVGDKILGAIKRTAQGDDFKANISLGGVAEKFELTDDMIEFSKKIMKEGKLLFAGIDFIKSDRGYLVIEINTSADFMGFEKATGVNVAGEIVDAFVE